MQPISELFNFIVMNSDIGQISLILITHLLELKKYVKITQCKKNVKIYSLSEI